ncbi:MAG: hypothetical protein GXO77_16790, partial [Calditrichaeota bacterium]|nr:hypothetical protein [Calditrichota bacterium]
MINSMQWNEILKAPTTNDLLLSVGVFLFIFTAIFLSSVLKNVFNASEKVSRKTLHISVGIAASLAPLFFDSAAALIFLALFFTVFNFISVKKGIFKSFHKHLHSFGTVYFPLAYLVLILFFWTVDRRFIVAGISLFAVAQSLSAIAGERRGSRFCFVLVKDRKSVAGSCVMFILSFSLIYSELHYLFPEVESVFLISIFVSTLVTVIETLSSRGSDNLFVPVGGALF